MNVPPPPENYRAPLCIGPVRLASRFTLAPLAGYTNYPFRRTVRELGGVGLCTTDLVNARAILEGSKKTRELLATGPDDRPLSVQIFGGSESEMCAAAKWLQDYGATMIDINMGCPVRKVVRVGGGSAMMCDTTGATLRLVENVVKSVKLPVTVKMRLGWDATSHSAPGFARDFENVGVAALTIHGRTREQGFTGLVDLDGIARVVEAVQRIPVFGNGDVMTFADAARMAEVTGCHGIAIGRGALANPFFFRQLANWVQTGDPGASADYADRLRVMRLHLVRLSEWRGDERAGCIAFRKVAAWYAKALRLPKETKHRLTMIESMSVFDAILAELELSGPPGGWSESDALEAQVSVPAGPNAHW